MSTVALSGLRSRLNGLLRRRALVRCGTALALMLTATALFVAAVFLLDWSLGLSVAQRAVVLIAAAAVLAWCFLRFAWPRLTVREDEVDMALLVERRQGVDSDLTAALQFQSPHAADWGSPQLEAAVVAQVDRQSSEINVLDGFSWSPLPSRLIVAVALMAALVIAARTFPSYARAFLDRALLGGARYPTRTVIEALAVNDARIPVHYPSESAVRVPFGRPLRFTVDAAGELPTEGRVYLTSRRTGVATDVPLRREPASDDNPDSDRGAARYVAELPRLIDDVVFHASLGDDRTESHPIDVIALPVVVPHLTPEPPEWVASADAQKPIDPGVLRVAVDEGSRVGLEVVCRNKDLARATFVVDGRDFQMEPVDGDSRTWRLPESANPLRTVHKPVAFAIRTVDVDGLSPSKPLEGEVRIRADRPPTVDAFVVGRRYLPAARPRIGIEARDDRGLSKIRLHIQIDRAGGSSAFDNAADLENEGPDPQSNPTTDEPDHEAGSPPAGTVVRDVETVPPERQPSPTVRGFYTLDLAEFDLNKGDELKLTLEAFDYRGDAEPKSALSRPLLLRITDRSGFLAGQLETDERSARRLDAVIERELGTGDSP